jgi:hypothetical protein
MILVNLLVNLISFLLALLVFIFAPGFLLVSSLKLKLSSLERISLSLGLGIVFFTFISFVFAHLHLRFLVFPVFFIIFLYFLYCFFRARKKHRFVFKLKKPDLVSSLIIGFASLIQLSLMVKSGTPYQEGLAFWGVHGYDGIWHASLISELARYFPPQNPGFAGEALKNYHFLTDLFMAQLHNFSRISILNLYFRFIPLFLTPLLNVLIFVFAQRWSKNKNVACWAVFFASIVGSFGYLPQLIGKGSNNWETAFWGVQPASAFLNPPFALSLIILMAGIFLLSQIPKKPKKSFFIIAALVFGILIGFKVYAGLIVLTTLLFLGIWRLIRNKEKSILLIFFLSLVFSLLVYLPTSSDTTGFMVFEPWWFIRTMVQAPDRLNWPALELRRQTYVLLGDFISLGLLQAFVFSIFLVGNLGIRFIGFPPFAKRAFKGSLVDRFLILASLVAFVPPIFFVQKAVPWNSIQFLYYFIFLFSFFAALSFKWLLKRTKFLFFKLLIIILLVSLALPSTLKTIYWFNAPTPTTLLEEGEFEGLNFLRANSKVEEIILTYPFIASIQKSFKEPPVPMTYYNSPYVAFFTGRRVFLEDQNAATILGYDLEGRLAQVEEFFATGNPLLARDFLLRNKISYLYLVGNQDLVADKQEVELVKIFDNRKVRIFQFNGKI